MRQYLQLLEHIKSTGIKKPTRTNIDCLSIFGYQLKFDLSEGFPLVTTKQCHIKSIVHELLWFLRGDSNIEYLKNNNVSIWDEWADSYGDLGPIYGVQWRRWETPTRNIDQIDNIIQTLKTDPNSRRLILSSWNVGQLSKMTLLPCHCLAQFYVECDRLHCQLYQRSADAFLGLPFNIACYSLLLMIISQIVGLKPGKLFHVLGDVHIYTNHFNQVNTQLTRNPYPLPQMMINKNVDNIDNFVFDDFKLINYKYHPKIYAPVAI